MGKKQEAAIAALLTEATHQAAAEKVGIAVTTLQRWLNEPGFKAAFRTARLGLIEDAVTCLQRATHQSVATLVKNLGAPRPGDQIRAALIILEQAFHGAQLLDIETRLEELEERVPDRKEGKR